MRAKHIPQVLSRPNLIMGGEREPVLLTGLMASCLVITTVNLPGLVCGIAIWAGAIPLWRMMAKADPQMLQVYIRSLKYKRYYPARSRPYRKESGDDWYRFRGWISDLFANAFTKERRVL